MTPATITTDATIYLSGPMTGLDDYNRPAFDAAENWLRDRFGCEVLNPARHPDGWAYADYMREAFRDLCDATAVVLLPGWSASRGSVAEVSAASILGLDVVELATLHYGEKGNTL